MNAQTVERRIVSMHPVKLEKRDVKDGQAETFVGYGAVFYDPSNAGTEYQLFDGMSERIMPGCFDRCLREKQDVRGLFNHQPDNLLGRCGAGTMRLSIDSTGLRYEIDYNPSDPDHQRVRAKLERGDIPGSSFSFMVRQQTWLMNDPDADDIRELRDVDVLDVGPVSFPAYAGTSAGVRAIGDTAELRCACQAAQRGAVTFQAGSLIDDDTWDPDSALQRVKNWAHEGDRMNMRKFSRAFAWHDGTGSEAGCRMLHHDVRDGKLHVHRGAVDRCMRSLGEGGGGIPEEDLAAVHSHLERHATWAGDDDDDDDQEKDRAIRSEQDRLRLRLAEAEA